MSPEQFIRKICHDLRAPMRGLSELPTWIEEDLNANQISIPASVVELLDMQKTQAKRLDLIVIGLSEIAKINRTEDRARTAIGNVEPSNGWPKNLRCEFGVDDVPLEQSHAKLAINHLVDNAFKHADADQNSACLSVSKTAENIRIAVADFGPGIEHQYREKVFEPLTTLKPRDVCEGSGMGLAVVSRIAEIYGGSCAIRSNADSSGIVSELIVPAT